MSDTTAAPGRETQDEFEEFLRQKYKQQVGDLAQRFPKEQQTLHVDWSDLFRYDREIAESLLDDPRGYIRSFETALANYDLPVDVDLSAARVGVYNCPDQYDPAEVSRDENIDKYVAISGQVAKVSDVKPKCVEAAFRCVRCETLTRVPQDGETFEEPHQCRSCERDGPFKLNRGQSEFEDHQAARIQQPPEDTDGGNATHIDVYLTGDLTEQFTGGDRVTVNGILDIDTSDFESPVFDTQLDSRDVVKEESDYEDIEVDKYLPEIREIASGERGDPFDLWQESIHPTHEGDDKIKLALALQVFSGWAREYPSGDRDRGDVHILLLGDPGCDKSGMLSAVADLAPRSVYSGGKGSSAAGLTASAVRDDFGDAEWGLEAGTLVLASGGIACVDEIDKMDEEDRSAMHGAMEGLQQVHINKAGIDADLNTRASLLAAGNPKHGRFDQYQPFAEQINMDPALISRFDLMFMLTDEPDRETDSKIVSSKIDSRSVAGKHTLGKELSDEEEQQIEPEIRREVMRAYIAFAKENVFPRIKDEDVRRKLLDYFVELRQANKSGADDETSPVPVTHRKEEAIERLAEASARIRLSDEVEEQDVERAVSLVESSLRQVGKDTETDQLDADVIETGQSHSQRDRRTTVLEAVDDANGVTLDDLDDQLEEYGRGEIENELDYWSTRKGEIYDRGDGVYLKT